MTGCMPGYANPQLLITPAELGTALGVSTPASKQRDAFGIRHSPSPPGSGDASQSAFGIDARTRVQVIDTRPAELYAGSRIPGALYVDLWALSAFDTDPAPLAGFFASIAHLLTTRGIDPAREAIIYDTDSGVRAARAFWFFEYFGHPHVRVLDGGFAAWVAAGLPVEVGAASAPGERTGWPEDDRVRREGALASWKDVKDRLGRNDVAILDTRSDEEYRGTVARAKHAGAIPGAIHIEYKRNLSANGAFKSADDLKKMYEAAGVTPDREVITYCQGGYRAAHSYLALRLLGYPRVRNYVGSWGEWGNRDDLPVDKP